MYPHGHETYTERRMRAFHCCLALFLLLPGCSGGGAMAGEAKSAADDEKSPNRAPDGATETVDAGEAPNTDRSIPDKPKGPSCKDGTCSLCGGGICPSGWYCDEKAAGGAACSWLTECADRPTCGCVTRVLGSSCKCRDENGAVKVACD